ALGLSSETALETRIFRGVVRGTLERVFMDSLCEGLPNKLFWKSVSTSALFDHVQANDLLSLFGTDTSQAQGSEDQRARIQDALAAGLLVVAPRKPVALDDSPRLAWWQIDPGSGETIAVTDEGLHQGTMEYRLVQRTDSEGTTYSIYQWFVKDGTRE